MYTEKDYNNYIEGCLLELSSRYKKDRKIVLEYNLSSSTDELFLHILNTYITITGKQLFIKCPFKHWFLQRLTHRHLCYHYYWTFWKKPQICYSEEIFTKIETLMDVKPKIRKEILNNFYTNKEKIC